MYSSVYVWAKVLAHMEERLDTVTISAYFDDAEIVELNDEHLILYSSIPTQSLSYLAMRS